MRAALDASHLQCLLGVAGRRTCGIERIAATALLVFAGGQLFFGLGQRHLGLGLLFAGLFELLLHFLPALHAGFGQCPGRLDLFLQRTQPVFGLLAALHDHADLGFERRDAAVDLVEGRLPPADLVVGRMDGLAQRLHAVLGRTQPRLQALDLEVQAFGRFFQQLLLGLGVVAFDQPQPLLLLHPLGLHGPVAAGHLGLGVQLADLPLQLAQDVLHTGEVLARVGEAVFGFAAALLVLGDARGLLEEHPQLVRLGLDDA